MVLAAAYRVLAIIGMITVLWHWKQINKSFKLYLIMLACVLGYFVAMYGFLGQSRFRIPLEPILAIIAILGLLDFNKHEAGSTSDLVYLLTLSIIIFAFAGVLVSVVR